jgi:hypothetical protein
VRGSMIDQDDKLTVGELTKPRRGRPPSGKALTPAQRKASQRRQNFTYLCKHVDDIDFNTLPLSALLEYLPRAIKGGRVTIVDAITTRLKFLASQNVKGNKTDKSR